jgi:ABC-2 type transport system ATP-binding protein
MTLAARPHVLVGASTLLVDVSAAEAVRALTAEGVDTILLKGPSIARALYEHGGERAYCDVDVLVQPGRLEAAGKTLTRLGYAPIEEPVLDAEGHHARTWMRQQPRAVVDLHRTLPGVEATPEKVWDSLSRRTEYLEVGGLEMRVLVKPALALHLTLHAVSHGPDVTEPIRDLECALDQWGIDVWRGARDLADEFGARMLFKAGLMLVAAGKQLCDELDIGSDLPADLALATCGPPGSAALYRFRHAAGWQQRMAMLGRQIVPPRAYIEAWSLAARRGRVRRILAYAHRWLVVTARLPRAMAAGLAGDTPSPERLLAGSQAAAPLLTVASLTRSFGDRTVVRNLDLTLEAGDRIAFWGPNGSGKTTVMRCIAGTLAPSGGSILVSGHEAGSIRARRLLGVSLAQERSFYMRLSGWKNLVFFARLRYPDEASALRAVEELADELDLHEILVTRADACSAGMLQQLALARALLAQPELILLDEPTRSLDAAAVERMWAALDRRPGAAAIVATHSREDLDHCGRSIAFPT